MHPRWISLMLAVMGAVVVHSALFLAGVPEVFAIAAALVAGPAISAAVLRWAPVGVVADEPEVEAVVPAEAPAAP